MAYTCGYKIPDFVSRIGQQPILELVNARAKHVEMHWLRKALCAYGIPSTFDDRFPEENADGDASRLMIGSTYLVPNERGEDVPGLLVDACVLEAEHAAYGVYRLRDGRHITCKTPLTDTELAVFRQSPQTFFGAVKDVSKNVNEPLDCYDFFWDAYGRTSREKLLHFMSGWPDVAALSVLGQKDLAQTYCARLAEDLWRRHRKAAPLDVAE